MNAIKSCFYLTVIISITMITCIANGQDHGLFSGRGLDSIPLGGRSLNGSSTRPNSPSPVFDPTGRIQDLSIKKPSWPKILDFSRNDSALPESRPFSNLFKKPSFDLFKNKPQVPELFSRPKTLADFFPRRDPNKPNFFQQINSKSKDFLSRTTDWAAKKNQGLRERSSNFGNAFNEIEANALKGLTQPAQPNIRTAESLNKPRIRF